MKFDYNNPSTLVAIYDKLQNKYPNGSIVITLEEKGCLYQVGNEIKIMPGLKVQPVDTTGAGDIFHGAFTYGIANNFDMEKTIPNLSEVLDYYAKKTGQINDNQQNS